MSPTATLVVVDGYDASTYGERFAEVYDDWYGDVSDIEACTRRLAALSAAHGGGPVLELGIGSGRLALPLARLGVEVHGIDASASMVERLRAKPGGESVTVTIGDMADLALADPPPFSVVFVAFNTLFNLATDADQRRCLRRVTEVLAPGGVLVVEAFVHREPRRSRRADHHRPARAPPGERDPTAALAPPLPHSRPARRPRCRCRARARSALGGVARGAVHRRERGTRVDVPSG
jgi:SAM-dependent methyltransferase